VITINKTRKTIENAKFHLQIYSMITIVLAILISIMQYIKTFPAFNTSLVPAIILGSVIGSTILYTPFLIYSKIQSIKNNKKAAIKINEYLNAINIIHTTISKKFLGKKIKTRDFDKLGISYIPFETVEIYMFDIELSTKNTDTGNIPRKDRKQKTKRHIKEYIKTSIRPEISGQCRFINFYPKNHDKNTSDNDTLTIGIEQSTALKYPKDVYESLVKIKDELIEYQQKTKTGNEL